MGCSPWGREESDTTEQLRFHFSLSCTGEGNGNPFQCSCLEYPRNGGAWWAAIYGVAQSQTRLKRLSSSSRLASMEKVLCPHILNCHFLEIVFLLVCAAAATAVKSLQSCPTLCDPIDGSLPGSPVPGILQARTMEWVAISFSNA